ncbi:GMC family oxidoreductase [Streptomyces tendae]|uniref:GMC family oxidoreductase n=1 Tax=Streptomyces tendae TaxID=1932 RepID=UPI003407FCBE
MPAVRLPAEAHTIVIGGGTGGAACAGLLTEQSSDSVLLLESGPDYGAFAEGRWPADVLDARTIPLSHDWGLAAEPSLDGAATHLPRARVLGGCSSHNGCSAAFGARADYDDWAYQGNPGWEAEAVEPMLRWVHSRFRVRRCGERDLTVAQSAFVAAGRHIGLPFADDLDDLDAAVGIGPMPVNVHAGVRWNAAFAFLDPVRDAPHLTVVGDTTVRRVLLKNGTVVGVEVDRNDGVHTVRADRVIVAAGAYHSPVLLMRSGVGPADELRVHGIKAEVDLPGVGRHLLDHPCIQLDFQGRDGLFPEMARSPWHPDEQVVGRAKSLLCDDGPYDIHVLVVAGGGRDRFSPPTVSLFGGAMRAISEGRVTLRDSHPGSPPVIDHRYTSDPSGHDRKVLAEAEGLLHRLAADPGLASVLGASALNVPRREASYHHPAGTCKMGPSYDRLAVVDPHAAVHGISGLYVADASIMPSITRTGINLPTAMIGAHVAADILKLSVSGAVSSSILS